MKCSRLEFEARIWIFSMLYIFFLLFIDCVGYTYWNKREFEFEISVGVIVTSLSFIRFIR